MATNIKGPRKKEDNSNSTFEVMPAVTPRRIGGDDAIAETSATDSRLDEKVIVNEQRENKIVNSPSQTSAHNTEGENTVDEL